MERHLSTGVATIVALMVAQRAGFGSTKVAPDGAAAIHFEAGTEATSREPGCRVEPEAGERQRGYEIEQ